MNATPRQMAAAALVMVATACGTPGDADPVGLLRTTEGQEHVEDAGERTENDSGNHSESEPEPEPTASWDPGPPEAFLDLSLAALSGDGHVGDVLDWLGCVDADRLVDGDDLSWHCGIPISEETVSGVLFDWWEAFGQDDLDSSQQLTIVGLGGASTLNRFVETRCERGAGKVYIAPTLPGYALVFPWSNESLENRYDAAEMITQMVNRAAEISGMEMQQTLDVRNC